jgi:hypothetical protein
MAGWRPTITNLPLSDNLNPGGKYQIFGMQFNGLSQGNAFGDEFQVSTNFPLVRIKNNTSGDVRYAKTYSWSTSAVATGSEIVSTWFDIPTISSWATARSKWWPTASHPCR